jgi:acetylornithine deacetylase/succinyl-diaminopimelate desuccinylase-like protein
MDLRHWLLLGIALSVHAQAGQTSGGPFDAKARVIYAKVVSMPTQLGDHRVPAMAEYLAQEFRAGGFPASDITILPFKGSGDETASLIVRYRGTGTGGKPILLLGHMDVVTAKREEWARDPFELIEKDGYFYGRGTYDNKQGVTAITATLLRLRAEGFKPNRDLIVFFSGDEETADETALDVVRNHRDLIDAEFALNSDAGGGWLDEKTGKPLYYYIQSAEKTYVNFSATVHNPGGHSSLPRPDNAIFDLAAALLKLQAHRFPVMWNETTIASLKASGDLEPGELGEAVKRFANDPKEGEAAEILTRSPDYVGQIRTTCVPTLLAGGHAPNALPQTASLNVNCRVFPGVTIEDVQQELQGVMGPAVELKVVGHPMWSDASPLREDVTGAVARAVHRIHPGVPVGPAQSAGASNGKTFRSNGIPTYGVDGNFTKSSDDFTHGLNERLSVRSFYDSLTFWYWLLKDIAGKARR